MVHAHDIYSVKEILSILDYKLNIGCSID